MVITAIGQKGSGKTYYIIRRTRELARENPTLPVLIHDQRGWMAGAIGRLAHPEARYRNRTELLRRGFTDGRLKRRFNLLYQCDAEQLFAIGKRWALAGQPCILVCDELDLLPQQLNQKSSAAYWCLNYGRPVPLHVLGCARNPQNMDKCFLSQADELALFHLTTMQALGQIRKCGLADVERAVTVLPRLRQRQYILLRG